MNHWIAILVTALAVWIVVSGLDDFVVDLAFVWSLVWRKSVRRPELELTARRPKRIAIFVPLWGEDDVIGRMLERNLAAIDYENYHFFIGAYPNDEPTLDAIREWEARSPKIHLAICPHDGPTSKADCLNWIFQEMLVFEKEQEIIFQVIVTHDAEDLIHPESLRLINYHTESYDMVQIPVLPLPTPFRQFIHGIYCDEFAEFQTKDVPVRQMLGGFVPSNGVGTGYTRLALERLAAGSKQIFEPECLTEDYENGLRLHKLGCSQLFVPIRFRDGQPVATREYFPSSFRTAVKQRTRWVMGIALQSWERHGWRGGFCQVYWFWRDRKALAGSPIGLLANAIYVYGGLGWLWNHGTSLPWITIGPVSAVLFSAALSFQAIRIGVRVVCAARIYGWKFAAGVPVRAIWGNWINGFATISALRRYIMARLRHEPLAWLKTQHVYPSRCLGEMLVSSGFLKRAVVEGALRSKPAGVRIGEHLVRLGLLTEAQLYQTLSAQQNLPLANVDPAAVPRGTARHFPARLAQRWKVLPYRIEAGRLLVAATDLPAREVQREMRDHTRLEIRFHLITPANFERLERALI